MTSEFHSTTVLCLRRDARVVMAADGQVTMGSTVMKGGARKIRRLFHEQVLVGFAGATADAFTLFERLEGKLEAHGGNLARSAVELAKDWRTDKYLRHLEAMLLAANKDALLLISGSGDVIEPESGVAAIGSGGPMALAAARALLAHSRLSLEETARQSLLITSQICIYTNDQIMLETLPPADPENP